MRNGVTEARRLEQRKLGNSGETAPLVLGGNVFGWTADEPTSFAILDAFVDAGFNMIDTADSYSKWVPGHHGGESETIIGRWLKRSGKRFMPRKVAHMWGCVHGKPGKIINCIPARRQDGGVLPRVGKPPKDLITGEQMGNKTYTKEQVNSLRRLFEVHGMKLLAPPGHEPTAA